MISEAKQAANARYDAKTARYYSLKLNQNTDSDILNHLAKKENIQGYLKELIRKDMKEANTMKITNLHHDGNQWFFRNAEDSRGVYYTNGSGEGLFFQSDRTGETKQIIGTCQFSACSSASGMRKKIQRLELSLEDPRI